MMETVVHETNLEQHDRTATEQPAQPTSQQMDHELTHCPH